MVVKQVLEALRSAASRLDVDMRCTVPLEVILDGYRRTCPCEFKATIEMMDLGECKAPT